MRTINVSNARLAIAITVAVLLGNDSLARAHKYWVGPAGGLWSDPNNWSNTPGGAGGAGPPQVVEAGIAPSGITAQFDYAYAQPGIGLEDLSSPVMIHQDVPSSVLVVITEFRLPRGQTTGSGIGRYIQSAGSSVLNSSLRLGWTSDLGANVQGFYTLSGNATLNIGSNLLATHGVYTQNGGFCTIALPAILGDPIFEKPGGIDMSGGELNLMGALSQRWGASTFNGGVTTIAQSISITDSSVTLSGGVVSAAKLAFGVSFRPSGSQFIQNGGSLTIANEINLGSNSFYRFNSGSMSCAALNVGGNLDGPLGEFLVGPGADKVVRTRAINFTSNGKMDINQAAATVDYEAASASPLSTIRGYIIIGYNNGSWNGAGGIMSSFAASNPGYGVGYAEASALGSIPGIFGAVDSDTILIRLTRYGDADLNGFVNLEDFNLLAGNFGAPSGATWSQADFNYDGIVNLTDFNLLAGNFGLAASADGPTPQDWANLAAAVPEPGLAFLFSIAAPLLRRGRRSDRLPPPESHTIDPFIC